MQALSHARAEVNEPKVIVTWRDDGCRACARTRRQPSLPGVLSRRCAKDGRWIATRARRSNVVCCLVPIRLKFTATPSEPRDFGVDRARPNLACPSCEDGAHRTRRRHRRRRPRQIRPSDTRSVRGRPERLAPDDADDAGSGFERWRRDSALGAVGTGVARGLQAVFAPPVDEPVIVASVPGDPPGEDERIRVILDPDDPTKSVAHRRPKHTGRPRTDADLHPPDEGLRPPRVDCLATLDLASGDIGQAVRFFRGVVQT